MHDIDAQISKISGQSNYMEYLQKITGNIMNVDMNMYHEKHTKIFNCDNNIRKVLERIHKEDESIASTLQSYTTQAESLDIEHKTFYLHIKKSTKSKKVHPPKEKISPGYQPSDLVKTDWFHTVKHIEKAVNKFLMEVFPTNNNAQSTEEQQTKPKNVDLEKKTYEELEQEFNEHPELVDIKTILDVKIISKSLFTSFMLLKRFCKIIINILLLPMYDVRKTIESHWDQINKIFKTKAFQSTQLTTPEDVISILHQFIIAKYRATVTGNNKHYVRLFFDTVGNDSISNMDGARFLEIMDSIDLDKLDKEDQVYKFASAAKTTMQKIAHNEAITPDLLAEFDSIFANKDETSTPTETEKIAQTTTVGADIFDTEPNPNNDEPTANEE